MSNAAPDVTTAVIPHDGNPQGSIREGMDGHPVAADLTPSRPDAVRTIAGKEVRRYGAGTCSTCRSPRVFYADANNAWLTQPHCRNCDNRASVRSEAATVAVRDFRQDSRDERTRFAEDFPTVAASLPPLPSDPPALFKTGAVVRSPWKVRNGPMAGAEVVPDAVWRDLIDRHQSGDHGAFGTSSAGAVPRDDVAFAPELATVAERNALSVTSGVGLIFSRFPIPDDLADRLPVRQRGKLALEVVTNLPKSGAPETLCRSVRIDS
jgi:hypothetical protein